MPVRDVLGHERLWHARVHFVVNGVIVRYCSSKDLLWSAIVEAKTSSLCWGSSVQASHYGLRLGCIIRRQDIDMASIYPLQIRSIIRLFPDRKLRARFLDSERRGAWSCRGQRCRTIRWRFNLVVGGAVRLRVGRSAVTFLLPWYRSRDPAAPATPIGLMGTGAQWPAWFPDRYHQPFVRVGTLCRTMAANAWLAARR